MQHEHEHGSAKLSLKLLNFMYFPSKFYVLNQFNSAELNLSFMKVYYILQNIELCCSVARTNLISLYVSGVET